MEHVSPARASELPRASRELWPEALDLTCQLVVSLKVPQFTIRDLLALSMNSLVNTGRREGAHVPVAVNGVMIAWAEFDVIDGKLAVRMTEMI
jgi:flagellar motor switch protein FliN/FliY